MYFLCVFLSYSFFIIFPFPLLQLTHFLAFPACYNLGAIPPAAMTQGNGVLAAIHSPGVTVLGIFSVRTEDPPPLFLAGKCLAAVAVWLGACESLGGMEGD